MCEEPENLPVVLRRVKSRRDASGALRRRRCEGDRSRDDEQCNGTSAQPQGSQNMTSWYGDRGTARSGEPFVSLGSGL